MGAVTVIGSYLSPYVRKVLVCLELQGIDYEIDPIVPFYGNDEFERISPLRRIPVLIGEAWLLVCRRGLSLASGMEPALVWEFCGDQLCIVVHRGASGCNGRLGN